MRVEVPLRSAYKLLNHGPTTLISAAHEGRRNVMAAAWVMPLDFEPPKLAAVIAASTFTREIVLASGEFVVQTPCLAQRALTITVGNESGRERDKFAAHGIATSPASKVRAPLIDGCVAWLECVRIAEPTMEERYDLFVGEVVAAWVDAECWDGRGLVFPRDELRTIHHLAGGAFFATGSKHAD
ncbi:MAG: flavin reductase family protein [Planctomycetes bacterium]|nr:flavin reductase family protein [Planctomycetota bacterium]